MLFLMIAQVLLFVKKNVKNKFCPLRACSAIIKRIPGFLGFVKRAFEGKPRLLRACCAIAKRMLGFFGGVKRLAENSRLSGKIFQ
jgi:hypothetical protein